MSPSGTDFLRSSRTSEIWQGGDSIYPYKIRGRKAFAIKRRFIRRKSLFHRWTAQLGKIPGIPYW